LAIPEAGTYAATCTDISLDVIFYMSKLTLFMSYVADMFWDIWWNSNAAVKRHTITS
jgi:hypothetical protein